MLSLLLDTGIRRGELAALRLGDLNLGQGLAFIEASTSKSRRGRAVVYGDATAKAVMRYLRHSKAPRTDDTPRWVAARPSSSAPPHLGVEHVGARAWRRATATLPCPATRATRRTSASPARTRRWRCARGGVRAAQGQPGRSARRSSRPRRSRSVRRPSRSRGSAVAARGDCLWAVPDPPWWVPVAWPGCRGSAPVGGTPADSRRAERVGPSRGSQGKRQSATRPRAKRSCV